MEPEVFTYLDGPDTVLEQKPLMTLANEENLLAFKHSGFWHPMDTLRDKTHLEQLVDSNQAPWIVWNK
jgi:glucose-1-phosphate cytidylyltransferase